MTDNACRAPDSPGKGVPAPWNYYYLRYFVGAIVGAGLLVALWVGDSDVLPSFPHTFPAAPHDWLNFAAAIAALGTAGLAYCYIASAPILLMHGLRFRLSQQEGWWWVIRLIPIAAIVLLSWFALRYGTMAPSSFRGGSCTWWWLYVPYGTIMLLQIAGLPWGRLDTVRRLYVGLAERRAKRLTDKPWGELWIREYIESYRHLREHGNAFLIILMEVILATALYEADTTIRFFTLVVIWIVPATFSWFLGTWLEFRIVPGKASPLSAKKSSCAGRIRRRICRWIQSHCTENQGGADPTDGT